MHFFIRESARFIIVTQTPTRLFSTMVPQPAVTDDVFYCRVGIIDALGNAILHGHTIPYNIGFQGFLERLQVDTFHPLLRIGNDADYVSWAKRLEFLSSDLAAIAKLEFLIEQHKTTDYKKLAEWLWVCPEVDFGGKLITGEKEFNAFMALARSKELGNGCLMRVSPQTHPRRLLVATLLKCDRIRHLYVH